MAVIRGDYATIFLVLGLAIFFVGLYGLIKSIVRKDQFRFYAIALLISFALLFIGDAFQPEDASPGNGLRDEEESDLHIDDDTERDTILPPDDDMETEEQEAPVEEDEPQPDPEEVPEIDEEIELPEEQEEPEDDADLVEDPEPEPEPERDTSRSILFN